MVYTSSHANRAAASEAAVVVEKPKSIWTKEMRALLRSANNCHLRVLPKEEGAESWDKHPAKVIFTRDEVKRKGRPYQPEERWEFSVQAHIRNGYMDEVRSVGDYGSVEFSRESRNLYAPKEGFWGSIHLSKAHEPGPEQAALAMIPVGAEVEFEVYLDAMANGYSARGRVHGDCLFVKWKKGKQVVRLLVDTTLVMHNTARFGYR
jgi:hypothetical protein